MLRGGNLDFFAADGLGSVTSLTDGSGAIGASYTYESFGGLLSTTGTLANAVRYTGREYDAETGMYYYRARYYDSRVGRFISEDPIGLGGGLNFYRYTLNNPVLFNDPMGLWQNTGKPADPKINTIVCNGQGGVSVQIGTDNDPEGLKCAGDCMRAHENKHRQQALASSPTICKGSVAGIQVAFSNVAEENASEIAASAVEIICLLNKEKGGCGKCKQIIEDRIKQMRNYRDKFKK